MAAAVGAPIIPCAVWGSHRLLTKGRRRDLRRGTPVEVRYGEPFHPSGGDPVAETAELMRRITDCLGAAQAAYPEEPENDEDRWWLPAHLGGTALTPDEAEHRLREQHAERRRGRRQQREDRAG